MTAKYSAPAALIKFLKPYDREIRDLALQLRALLGKQEGGQTVLHVAAGDEDRVLIGGHQFLEPGVPLRQPDQLEHLVGGASRRP